MFKWLLILTLLVLALAFPADDQLHDGKIEGVEKDADIVDHPYQISLQLFDVHYCSGAIISKKHCLTAASCVDGVPAWALTVRVGSTTKNEGGEVFNVSDIVIHGDYNRRLMDYDCAVLTLARELTFGPGIIAIAVQDENEISEGSSAYVRGWERLAKSRKSRSALQGFQAIQNPICSGGPMNVPAAVITWSVVGAGNVGDACTGTTSCLIALSLIFVNFFFNRRYWPPGYYKGFNMCCRFLGHRLW